MVWHTPGPWPGVTITESRENPEPQLELHARIRMTQILGAPLYFRDVANLVDNSPFSCPMQEFEVIAQIKLLQNSAKNYQFEVDQAFKEWFNDINILNYKAW